jgi:hypothetical protein
MRREREGGGRETLCLLWKKGRKDEKKNLYRWIVGRLECEFMCFLNFSFLLLININYESMYWLNSLFSTFKTL